MVWDELENRAVGRCDSLDGLSITIHAAQFKFSVAYIKREDVHHDRRSSLLGENE